MRYSTLLAAAACLALAVPAFAVDYPVVPASSGLATGAIFGAVESAGSDLPHLLPDNVAFLEVGTEDIAPSANVAFYAVDDRVGKATGLAADLAPVSLPEPATWGLTMIGFGLLGGSLRRRERTFTQFV